MEPDHSKTKFDNQPEPLQPESKKHVFLNVYVVVVFCPSFDDIL